MATFERRGSGQWRVRIRRRGHPVETATFASKAEAEAWARGIESEMDRGVFVSRTEAEETTLHEALERFVTEYVPRLRSRTMTTYRVRALQRRDLAGRKLATIRGKDIADYIRERQGEGVNPHTIRRELGTISRVFEICRTSWGMESLQNPVALVRTARPKLPPGRNRRLEAGEEAELLSRARAYGGMIGPIIVLALETAMRRGEIAGLVWRQVDLGKWVIHLEETKNGERRDVPLSSRAVEVLKGLPRRLDGSIFGMMPDGITQAFSRITARAVAGKKGQGEKALEPIVDLRFHDLRHEATSRLFEKGFNPMEVAAITGHKTLEMLKRYTHLRAEDLARRLG
jgi:integrase